MRDEVVLRKIIMYCRRIADNLERYHHDFSAFENDHLFQDARCMCVVQIGELVSQLSDDVKQKNLPCLGELSKILGTFMSTLMVRLMLPPFGIHWNMTSPL